jgi:hypothetical protein
VKLVILRSEKTGLEKSPEDLYLQEFNTQEQPQADFGEKPGVVVNIGIKSGTDQLHGTAYYFGRNAALDARNYSTRLQARWQLWGCTSSAGRWEVRFSGRSGFTS